MMGSTKWQHVLQFHDLTKQCEAGTMTMNELCKELSKRIENHSLAITDPKMREFACRFMAISIRPTLQSATLDLVLEDFYNYADKDNRLFLSE